MFAYTSPVFAVSYLIDPAACVRSLVWNKDFTRATCKIRDGQIVTAPGRREVRFAIPAGVGQTQIDVSIYPLRNGYILRLNASDPVFPDQIEPLLLWTLSISGAQGIEAPEGICAKLLAEFQAFFAE